jgi:hypothetical protein
MIYDINSSNYQEYLVSFKSQGIDGMKGVRRGGGKATNAGGKGVIVSGCA